MKYLLAITICLASVFVGCQAPTPTPASIEEFSSTFRDAYDSGNKEAISRMFDWTNVDAEIQKIQLGILTTFIGDNRITDISTEPFDPSTPSIPINGREITLNVPPTHMFSTEHKGNAGFEGGPSSGSAVMPIGQKNGRYYFCGWTYE